MSRLFRLGGAHAIAALAYGTATIPRVDKIVGPGNAYVAAAKALVSRDCAIDFHAGPSEIVVVSRRRAAGVDRGRPHRPGGARSRRAGRSCMTPSRQAGRRGRRAKSCEQMPADGPARQALARERRRSSLTRTLAEAIALCQRMAPEHVVVRHATPSRRG